MRKRCGSVIRLNLPAILVDTIQKPLFFKAYDCSVPQLISGQSSHDPMVDIAGVGLRPPAGHLRRNLVVP